MTEKPKLEKLLDAAPRQTPEEIMVIQAHNDRVEKNRQLIDYKWATIGVVLIATGLLWAAHSQLQQWLAIAATASLALMFRYLARRGYHGHRPHIAILMMVCTAVFLISMIWYIALFF